jgi:hypothetical protein
MGGAAKAVSKAFKGVGKGINKVVKGVGSIFSPPKVSMPSVGDDTSALEYEQQVAEQRAAREKAEAEAETLKQNRASVETARRKRAQASYLTGGQGDEEIISKKSFLGVRS